MWLAKYLVLKKKYNTAQGEIDSLKIENYDLKRENKILKEKEIIEKNIAKIIKNLPAYKKRELGIIGGKNETILQKRL